MGEESQTRPDQNGGPYTDGNRTGYGGDMARFFLGAWVVWWWMGCGGEATARPWPDSSTGIVVFADQIPGTLNAVQREFAATHLAGTQKMLRDEIRALRVYNTNFLCLHYQLGVAQGPELFVIENAWSSDWAYVNTQSNWFMHNAASQRVYHTTWNWYLMDATYTNGVARTGWPNYWITTCLARIRSAEDDAVFADSLTQDAYAFGYCNPTHEWIESINLCRSNWIPALHAFSSNVVSAFDADGAGFLFLPNLGGMITSWDTTDFGLGHGGMIEGFCYWASGNYFDPDDWRLQMERTLALVRSNKTVIAQTYPDTSDYSGRMFATASYLLIKGSRTYLCMLTSGEVNIEYYPEYTISLGLAASNAPPALTNLWYAPWQVYRRNYERGLVLVNPGDSPVSVPDLGTNYLRVSASGGGLVDAAGSYGGALSYTPVTGLVLAAYSGVVLMNATSAPGGGSGTITNVAALHRSGQTFITWPERADLAGERYHVYRGAVPLAGTNLHQAARIYTLSEGSGRFYANRYNVNSGGTWAPRYTDTFVIEDDAPPLSSGVGLLVWTLASNDFSGAATGLAYYAVTAEADGVEQTQTVAGVGPVAEGVADPLPVRIRTFAAKPGPYGEGGVGHVMIQYMDVRNWNPTFHAPHERNGYYGLNPGDGGVTSGVQYAYDYVVVEPSCVTGSAPLYVSLHGWAGNSYEPRTSDPDAYSWCCYKIFPVDMSETWFFGFARDCDYRTGALPTNGEPVVNFTEQRILRMVYDTIRHPPAAAVVDTNRVYVYGGSMGASGSLAFVLRYPHLFAAAYASQPMTDYRHQGDAGGTAWRSDVEWKWGTVAQNLPVLNRGPGDWAVSLQARDGTGVWDWQDHQTQAGAQRSQEKVPLGIGHGTNDYVIEWPTQGQPVYPALDEAALCWGGAVTEGGHSWMGFNGLPPPIAVDGSLAPFRRFAVRKNETVPALSRSSANGAQPPVVPGSYNLEIEWSASWYNWDVPPVDETNRWQISLRSLSGGPQTVDVTPRRLQRLAHAPFTRVLWRNFPVGSSTAVQRGTRAADADGLLTITGVQVSASGNRLLLEVDGDGDADGDGMPDYWEAAYGFATNSPGGEADADGDGSSNRAEYEAGTDPLQASSCLEIAGLNASDVSWQGVPGFAYAVEWADDLAGHWGLVGGVTSSWPALSVVWTNGADPLCYLRVRQTAP